MLIKRLKIFVVGGDTEYANWMQGIITDKIEDANLVVFTGGEDVSPNLYKDIQHPRTSTNANRDNKEVAIFNKARELQIPMVGICRGSQFLCVMAGGRLVQHQDNPLYIHDIRTYDEKTLPITSTHHQAQYPYDLAKKDYQLLAWTTGLSSYHENGKQQEMPLKFDKEAEIVYYNNIDALGIQGHPEMMYNREEHKPTIEYLQKLLNKFMWGVFNEKAKSYENFT